MICYVAAEMVVRLVSKCGNLFFRRFPKSGNWDADLWGPEDEEDLREEDVIH